MLSLKTFEVGMDKIQKNWSKSYDDDLKKGFYNLVKHMDDTQFLKCCTNAIINSDVIKLPPLGTLKQYFVKSNKTQKYLKVRNDIEDMVTSSNNKYISDEPLTHKVVQLLGNIKRLGANSPLSLEIILNTTLKDLIEELENQTLTDIPLYLGDKNSIYLDFLGDKQKALNWVKAYILKNYEISDINEIDLIETIKTNAENLISKNRFIDNQEIFKLVRLDNVNEI